VPWPATRSGAGPAAGGPALRRIARPPQRRVLSGLLAAGAVAALVAGHLISGLGLVVLAVTAAAVAAAAGVLAGRAARVARSQAEADRLARLLACAIAEPAAMIRQPYATGPPPQVSR
jgi:hypothetical protein